MIIVNAGYGASRACCMRSAHQCNAAIVFGHEPKPGFPVIRVPDETSGWKYMSEIVDNPSKHRFELAADGHIAATYYEVADGAITFDHTEVPPELGGKGIGSKLVKGALDKVRADGLKVIAKCEFVKGYIGKHPEYADLLKR
jgi:uncharacterized protein